MIRLYLDEDFHKQVALALRLRGYDVVSAHELEKWNLSEQPLLTARFRCAGYPNVNTTHRAHPQPHHQRPRAYHPRKPRAAFAARLVKSHRRLFHLAADGCQLHHVHGHVSKPAARMPAQRLKDNEILAYVLEGEVDLALCPKHSSLKAGSFFFLPPASDFTVKAKKQSRVLYFRKDV
jgi:hypothetical protein